jgi:hypothetical protein
MIKIMGYAVFHRMKKSSTMSKLNPRLSTALTALAALGILLATALIASAAETGKPATMAAGSELPEGKRTTLGLYVTAAQAYEKWKAAPDKVKVIDVRTPEEYAFVGHPEMAWNIPLAFVTYGRKDGKAAYEMKANPDFAAEVKEIAGPTDILLVG